MFSTPTHAPRTRPQTEWETSVLEYALYMEDVIFERNEAHIFAVHTAKEDNAPVFLVEGLRDAGNKFIELIKQIVAKVRSWMQAIVNYFRKHFASMDTLIKDYPQLFDTDFDSFTFEMHEYDVKLGTPSIVLSDLVHDFNSLIGGLDGVKKEDIESLRKQWTGEDAQDSLRGEFAGAPVGAEEFAEALTKKLQGGTTVEVQITPASIKQYMQKYPELKKRYSDLLKTYNRHLQGLERLKTFFKNAPHLGYQGKEQKVRLRDISTDGEKLVYGGSQYADMKQLELINTIYNLCWTRTERYVSIFNTAYSTTFGVMREELKDYNSILRKALAQAPKKEEKR